VRSFLILALMLRVWWTPAFMKEQTGIVVTGTHNDSVIVRQENGNLVAVPAGIIYKSAWEDVLLKESSDGS
jgi:hypothetical protein